MTPVRPARLRPGVTIDQVRVRIAGDSATAPGAAARLITGRARVFWDPKRLGKKRDAIDTDQFTPAADCVSERLTIGT